MTIGQLAKLGCDGLPTGTRDHFRIVLGKVIPQTFIP